jgi:hypothetical protein
MRKKPDNILQKEWHEAEIPEFNPAKMSKMRPANEVLPDVVAAYHSGTLKRKRGSVECKSLLPSKRFPFVFQPK